jgi:hypothetical protein
MDPKEIPTPCPHEDPHTKKIGAILPGKKKDHHAPHIHSPPEMGEGRVSQFGREELNDLKSRSEASGLNLYFYDHSDVCVSVCGHGSSDPGKSSDLS